MSTYEVIGLRKYSRPDQAQKSQDSKSQNRHRGFLKDMLVQKFLSKHKLEIIGGANKATRDTEIKIQSLVVREFEKFMSNENFNQKSLTIFERQLLQKIKECLGDNPQVKIREQTAPLTQRKHEIKTNCYLDGNFDMNFRNSTSVAGSKSLKHQDQLQQNVSLPAIKAQNFTRNSLEKFKNSN